jgi:hypothetical protein
MVFVPAVTSLSVGVEELLSASLNTTCIMGVTDTSTAPLLGSVTSTNGGVESGADPVVNDQI